LHAVLINPGAPLPTPSVYRQFDAMRRGAGFAGHPAPAWRNAAEAFADIEARGNDLDAPARVLAPVLDDVAARLGADARVRRFGLSGSGATMFALVDDARAAAAAAEALMDDHPEWWVAPTQLAGA
jgi:4-diphosphocytidyl-2-C-methyl-D-erythritol kinase